MFRTRSKLLLLLPVFVLALAGAVLTRGLMAAPGTGYIVYGAPDGNIWRIAPDGAGKTRLTDDGTADSPVWTPGGGQIVFSTLRDQKSGASGTHTQTAFSQIYVMGSDGSQARSLSDGSGDDRFADVFPDGQRVLIVRTLGARVISGTLTYDTRLVSVRLDGSETRVLSTLPSTAQARFDGFPARVAPDGNTAVLVRQATGTNSLLVTVSLTSGTGSLITPELDRNAAPGSVQYLWPRWTPDGRIVVVRRVYPFGPNDNLLLSLDRQGRGAQVLVSGLTYEALANGFDVDWTSRSVIGARSPEQPGGQRPEEIYLITLDGNHFSPPLDSGHAPDWSSELSAPPTPGPVVTATAVAPPPGPPGPPSGAPLITTADPLFYQVWERTDRPVVEGKAGRSWTWGPVARTAGMQEAYAGQPGNSRLVQYFDKARMELNPAQGGRPAFVTNGLLVVEMISGRVQVGDTQYETRAPAPIQVSGDGQNNPAPSYALLANVASLQGEHQAPNRAGQPISATLGTNGTVGSDPSLARFARNATYIAETSHNIPDVFWTFLNQQGLVYVNGAYRQDTLFDWVFTMGYPITEAYWAKQTVGDKTVDVLIQAFQRQVLTFTPSNAPVWQVQFGNVAQHYYIWRYGKAP